MMTFRLTDPLGSQVLSECSYISEDADLVIRFECHCKWYLSYLDVRAHEDFFASFAELEDVNCAFARLGEDVDDCETRYTGDEACDLIHIRRAIDCNYPEGETLETVLTEI